MIGVFEFGSLLKIDFMNSIGYVINWYMALDYICEFAIIFVNE
jgi:hypothetical protein